MNPIGSISEPTLRTVLNAHRDEIFASLNCHEVGEIVSFDPLTQSAKVKIKVQRVVYNQDQPYDENLQQTPRLVDYPLLTDVPVFILTGGGATIQLPIAAGNPCLVLFNDRDIDAWFTTGSTLPPNSPRMHSLSDGFALVGFYNAANKLAGYSSTDFNIVFAGANVKINSLGAVAINTDGKQIQLSSGVGTSWLRITTDGKMDLTNASNNLKTALDALCTALTSWVNTGGSTPNPATVTAINAVKATLDSLLA